MLKHILPLLLAACLLLTGCAAEETPPAAKEFSQSGLTITLTDAFEPKQQLGFNGAYLANDLGVLTMKEEFTMFAGTEVTAETPVEEYTQLLWNANVLDGEVALTEADGLQYFQYDKIANDSHYVYRVYVFKSADAFWNVQFYTFAEDFSAMEAVIHDYAKSVTFD